MADRQVAADGTAYQCRTCERVCAADDFYVSNKTQCKECVKARARENRAAKQDYYRNYDRVRYREHPGRREMAKAQSAALGREYFADAQRRSRQQEPEKHKARRAVAYAVSTGKITRASGCYFCGSGQRLQAHHPDYSRPLDVFWLCPKCHGKLHTVNGDFLRGDVR